VSLTLVEPLRISFPARPEQVSMARHAMAEFGRQAGLDQAAVGDLETIVTEACMNAAAHAYEDEGDGRIEVAADVDPGEVSIVVRDRGAGIHPRPAGLGASRRLGLVLIAALASSVEIRSHRGEGTELRATLASTSA
jgi:anti-sigma regulatory factor (Ser/Thr protein kinase)